MTWFSLKRTLQSNLASSIEVLNPVNPDLLRSNLHTPLRYSAVLLSIGKTTQICHQNIPLKKVHDDEIVIYISAISRKLATVWHRPSDDIATMLLSLLHEVNPQPVWSSVQKTDDGWLKFVISQSGIDYWQHQLTQWPLPESPQMQAIAIEPEQLWRLQAGYELCCRWQRHCHLANSQEGSSEISSSVRHSQTPFLMPSKLLATLIHCLLDICDRWEQTDAPQLLRQVQTLVSLVEKCARLPELSAKAISPWSTATQIVLQQSLQRRLGYPLAKRL